MSFFKRWFSGQKDKGNEQPEGPNDGPAKSNKKDLKKQKQNEVNNERKNNLMGEFQTQGNDAKQLVQQLKHLIQLPQMKIFNSIQKEFLQKLAHPQSNKNQVIQEYVAPLDIQKFSSKAQQIFKKYQKQKSQGTQYKNSQIIQLLKQFKIQTSYQQFSRILQKNQQVVFINQQNQLPPVLKKKILTKISEIKSKNKQSEASLKVKQFLKSINQFQQNQIQQKTALILSGNLQNVLQNLPKKFRKYISERISKILQENQNKQKITQKTPIKKQVKLYETPIQLFINDNLKGTIKRVPIAKQQNYQQTKCRILSILLEENIITKQMLQQDRRVSNSQEDRQNGIFNLIELEFKFADAKDPLTLNEMLSNPLISIQQFNGSLKFIFLRINFRISLYWQGSPYIFKIQNCCPITKLRQILAKRFKVQYSRVEIFILESGVNEVLLSDDDSCSLSKFNQSLYADLTANLKFKLQHYGFNKNYKLNSQDFKFFIEDEFACNQLVQSCNKSQSQPPQAFALHLCKFFYSAIKKGFTFMHVIQKFKGPISKSIKNYIWESSEGEPMTLNSKFVLFYFLYNCDNKLKISIMRTISKTMSIPIVFRQFDNINSINSSFRKNQALKYVLKQGITITSIGFQKQKKDKKGKSQFLRKVFFIDQDHHQKRHPICQKCPLLYLRIFGNKEKINVIDIPSGTNEQIISQILKATNILLIQTWERQEDVQQFIRDLRKKGFKEIIFCFLKDQNTRLISIQNLTLENDQIIQIPSLKNVEQMHQDYEILRNSIYSAIKNNQLKFNKRKIFELYKSQQLSKFYAILDKINIKTIFQMKKIGQFSQSLKNSYKADQEVEKITNEGLKKGLHPILVQLFQYLPTVPDDCMQICCYLFRQKLKDLKTEAMKPYDMICIFKKKSQVLTTSSSQQAQKQLRNMKQYLQKIQNIPQQLKFSYQGKQLSQIKTNLQKLISHFQEQIQPIIFSYQLAWREFICHFKLRKIKNQQYLETFQKNIIKIKQLQIRNSIPFEIIDGDLLQISKTFLDCIFNSNLKVCVITILGPQSSGKSTLLNFLFGCDFSASQGRCTRGVYGTYFQLNKNQASRCKFDAILLLDTEGIMANTSLKDEQKRKNFDSKLILFCLAVSDIVLINTKGNIDSNTSNLLKLCKQKLDSLKNQQKTCPQYFLIQNMNSTNNMLQHIADINRLKDLFQQNKSKSLTQAYDIVHIDHSKVSLLSKDQEIIKKYSKEQFWKQSLDLLLSMFQALKQKKRQYRSMKQVIQQLQKSWVTIQKFPSLFQVKSKEAFKIQQQINRFKKVEFDKLGQKKQEYLSQFSQNLILQEQIQSKYLVLKKSIQQNYKNQIMQLKAKISQKDSNNIIDLESQKLKCYLQNRWNQIKNDIEEIRMNRTFQTQKRQGIQILKKKAQKIRFEMMKNNTHYEQDKLAEIFQNQFQKTIQKLQLKINISAQISQQMKKIIQCYQEALKNSQNNSYGLPTLQKQSYIRKEETQNTQFRKYLREKLFFGKMSQCKYFIKHAKKPHINILKGGLFDPKLKYLNMKQYFQAKQKKYAIGFYKNGFQKNLNQKKIKRKYFFSSQNKKDVEHQLNKCLAKYFEKIKSIIEQNTNYQFLGSEAFRNQYKKRSLFLSEVLTQSKAIIMFKQKQDYKKKGKSIYSHIKNFAFKDRQKQDQVFNKSQIQKFANSSLSQKQGMIFQLINFELIQQLIIKQQNLMRLINRIDLQSTSKVNQQLKPINIGIRNLFQVCFRADIQRTNGYINVDGLQNCFTFKYNNIKEYKNIAEIKQLVQKLQTVNIMQQNSANNLTQMLFEKEQDISQNFHPIGFFIKKNYQLRPNYRNQNILSKYISSNVEEVYHALQEKNMTEFLKDQLLQNKKIDQFLSEIDNIIKENVKSLSTGRSDVIFFIQNKISDEIREFNLDLRQVSHQLDESFVSYSHVYAIFMIWKLHCQIFKKDKLGIIEGYKQQKDSQMQVFINRCSNDQKKQIQAEVQQFKFEYQAKALYQIKTWKQKLLKEQQKKFKTTYNRAKIQDYVDRQVFNVSTSSQARMLEYIQNPHQILQEQFKKQQNVYFKGVKQSIKFNKNTQLNSFVPNIILEAKQLLQFLANVHKVQQQNSQWNDFIELEIQKNIKTQENEFKKQGQFMAFKYLLDLFLNDIKSPYKGISAKFKGQIKKQRKNINRMSQLSPNNRQILTNIKNNSKSDLSVKNICIFLQIMINSFQSIKKIITLEFQFSKKDFQIFAQKTKINFCQQTCPCCKRLCGVQHRPDIQNSHQCIFGHQIRGFGKICLENGFASVIRCEEMMEHFKINYNGSVIAWKQYKAKVKQSRNWIYDDCYNSDQDKNELFTYAWQKIGKIYCEQVLKGQIKYQKFEKALRQNQDRVHYILALDQSGSMGGQRWKNLMSCLKIIFQKLLKKSVSEMDTKISTIVFELNARFHQVYVSADEVNNDILNRGGQTSFQEPFRLACDIISKHTVEEQVSFIFMTDGQAEYPAQGIRRLKQLQKRSQKQKIKYSSIVFQGNSATLEQMAKDLNGTNYTANNYDQLLIAYELSMQIIKDN